MADAVLLLLACQNMGKRYASALMDREQKLSVLCESMREEIDDLTMKVAETKVEREIDQIQVMHFIPASATAASALLYTILIVVTIVAHQ